MTHVIPGLIFTKSKNVAYHCLKALNEMEEEHGELHQFRETWNASEAKTSRYKSRFVRSICLIKQALKYIGERGVLKRMQAFANWLK
jgi:hypothetical protein